MTAAVCIPATDCSAMALEPADVVLLWRTFAALVVAHYVIAIGCKPLFPGQIPRPSAKGQHKEQKEKEVFRTNRADIVANNVVGLFANLLAVVLATRQAATAVQAGWTGGAAVRLNGKWGPWGQAILLMVAYQAYSLGTTLVFDALRRADMIIHHVSVVILCLMSYSGFAQFYATFFVGIAEGSTALLCIAEVFRCSPPMQKRWPVAFDLSRLSFAAAFMILRIGAWLPISASFQADAIGSLIGGGSSGKEMGWIPVRNTFVVVFFMISNAGLTGLQVLWASKIVRSARKAIAARKKA